MRARPALGACVLSDWAKEEYEADVPILTVLHSFKANLEFDPHLHFVAGCTGLHLGGNGLLAEVHFPVDLVRRSWRDAVLNFFRKCGSKRGTQFLDDQEAASLTHCQPMIALVDGIHSKESQ